MLQVIAKKGPLAYSTPQKLFLRVCIVENSGRAYSLIATIQDQRILCLEPNEGSRDLFQLPPQLVIETIRAFSIRPVQIGRCG